jgi:hypothetical protein
MPFPFAHICDSHNCFSDGSVVDRRLTRLGGVVESDLQRRPMIRESTGKDRKRFKEAEHEVAQY